MGYQRKKELEIKLMNYPTVLTKKDVCHITGVQKTSIGNWLLSGKLPSFRCKGDYQILKADLIALMATSEYQEKHGTSK